MQDTTDIRFPYKPKTLTMVLVFLFFGACTAVFLMQLFSDDLGASRRLRGFAPETQRMIYWVLTGGATVLAALGLFGVLRSLTSKSEVVITDEAISAPKSGLSSKIETVPFAQLAGMDVTGIGRQKFLVLHHSGRKLNIAAQSLPKGMTVEELFHEVSARQGRLFGQG